MEIVHAEHVTGVASVTHWRGPEDGALRGGFWWRDGFDVVTGEVRVSLLPYFRLLHDVLSCVMVESNRREG